MAKRCAWCLGEMPTLHRADAQVCSTRCRVARHRASAPAALRRRQRWVRHDDRKRPLRADGGGLASSTDPATWSTHRAAATSKVGTGAGFVLNGDGIVCVDLDHCLVDGKPAAATRQLLARFPRTHIEVSPSGDGLHVWGYAEVKRGRRRVIDGVNVEVYGTGRYITITGKPYTAAPLADISAAIAQL